MQRYTRFVINGECLHNAVGKRGTVENQLKYINSIQKLWVSSTYTPLQFFRSLQIISKNTESVKNEY